MMATISLYFMINMNVNISKSNAHTEKKNALLDNKICFILEQIKGDWECSLEFTIFIGFELSMHTRHLVRFYKSC